MASFDRALPATLHLHAGDAAGGLHLSTAAGWNQTTDDWHLFLRHAHAIGCRDGSGALVASAAALPYGAARGWISMVLVDPAWRQRGLATRLMASCVEHLHASRRAAWLDATAAGEAVYRPLGFTAGFAFERWAGEAPVRTERRPEAGAEARIATLGEHDRIADLDRASSGLERGFVLHDFLGRAGTTAWLCADGSGFAIARAGQRALQLGPIVAAGAGAALALLGQALARLAGRVFVDVPVHCAAVAGWLEVHGFARQRAFVRMAIGALPAARPEARVFALAGPEFG